MRYSNEVLMKSFGDGIVMLRFQAEQTVEAVTRFTSECGISAHDMAFGQHPSDVFLLLDEGHPVTVIEVRNTEDEWEDLVRAVQSSGGEGFKSRVSNLATRRKTLAGDAAVA